MRKAFYVFKTCPSEDGDGPLAFEGYSYRWADAVAFLAKYHGNPYTRAEVAAYHDGEETFFYTLTGLIELMPEGEADG